MKNLLYSALITLIYVLTSSAVISQSIKDKIQCPAKIESATQLNKCGSKVKYVDPFQKVADNELVSLQCNSTSGSYFETGENTIYYKATDRENNSYFCIFKIKVEDQQKPYFTFFPKNLNSNAKDKNGAYVNWEKPQADDNCGKVHIVSSHKPGDYFPVGETLVTYWVHDTEGNFITENFIITVSEDVLSMDAKE